MDKDHELSLLARRYWLIKLGIACTASYTSCSLLKSVSSPIGTLNCKKQVWSSLSVKLIVG